MKILPIYAFFISALMFSCTPIDACEESSKIPACSDKPETEGETCLAYFESWFYDEEDGNCSKQGYSGCEPRGFETKEACEACDCPGVKH